MILREDGDIKTEDERSDDEMPPLVDASYENDVEYLTKAKLLVERYVLSVQVKEDDEE